jgi:hypothetical protein
MNANNLALNTRFWQLFTALRQEQEYDKHEEQHC